MIVFGTGLEKWVKNIVLVSEYKAPDDFICIYEKALTTTLEKNSRKKRYRKVIYY